MQNFFSARVDLPAVGPDKDRYGQLPASAGIKVNAVTMIIADAYAVVKLRDGIGKFIHLRQVFGDELDCVGAVFYI